MAKQIKQIIIVYDDGSSKGYNLNAFKKVLKIKFDDWIKEDINQIENADEDKEWV